MWMNYIFLEKKVLHIFRMIYNFTIAITKFTLQFVKCKAIIQTLILLMVKFHK